MLINTLGASCHITYNEAGLYNITKMNKLIQGSLGNVSSTKKGKICIKVPQVNDSEWVHVLWTVKYLPKLVQICIP